MTTNNKLMSIALVTFLLAGSITSCEKKQDKDLRIAQQEQNEKRKQEELAKAQKEEKERKAAEEEAKKKAYGTEAERQALFNELIEIEKYFDPEEAEEMKGWIKERYKNNTLAQIKSDLEYHKKFYENMKKKGSKGYSIKSKKESWQTK